MGVDAQKMENKKNIIYFILLTALFFTGCGSDSENSLNVKTSKPLDDVISDFTIIETEKGQKSWILEAARAKIKKNDSGINIIEVSDFNVVFLNKGDKVILKARKGNYNKQNSNINTRGKVVIKSSQKKIITSNVNWDPVSGEFRTKEKVEIHSSEGVLKGTGMIASSDLSDIKLTKDIEGEFSN